MPRSDVRRAWLVAITSAIAACGARTGLSIDDDVPPIATADAGGVPRDAATFDRNVVVDVDAYVEPPCSLGDAYAAEPVLTFPDRSALTPEIVMLDRDGPPSFVLASFAAGGASSAHPDVQVVRGVLVDGSSKVNVDRGPLLMGIESHGWGNLVHAPRSGSRPRSPERVALTWHGDPGGFARPMFRRLDVDGWSLDAPADITTRGEAVLSFASGSDGYAAIWRDVETTSGTAPVLALLDANGTIVRGPFAVAPRAPYPGRAPSVTWNGTSFLVATPYTTCDGDPLCTARAIVVTRIGIGGIEIVATIPAVASGAAPIRARIDSDGTRTWVAWSEGDASPDASITTRNIRLQSLDAAGRPLGAPITLAENVTPLSSPAVAATAFGVAVSWAEAGDPILARDAFGRSNIALRRVTPEGLIEARTVASPLVASYALAPSVGILRNPRGIVVAWSAKSRTPVSGEDVVYLARADCR